MLKASDLLWQIEVLCQKRQKDFTIITDTMNTNLEIKEVKANDGNEYIIIRNKQPLPEIIIEKKD